MANMSIPAPYEPEKSDWIHDRATRPGGPKPSRMEMARRWAVIAIGVVLGVGATALLFSIRDSWDNHREWLVMVIPFLVIAAIAVAHLVARRQVKALIPGGIFLAFALVFAGADLIADYDDAATDTARDVLSILAGICLGIATVLLCIALVWVEIRKPTKAPAPEL
jgi:hypothetical protein